jgi:ribosomal protein S7
MRLRGSSMWLKYLLKSKKKQRLLNFKHFLLFIFKKKNFLKSLFLSFLQKTKINPKLSNKIAASTAFFMYLKKKNLSFKRVNFVLNYKGFLRFRPKFKVKQKTTVVTLLYERFLGFLIKKGNKQKARSILDQAFRICRFKLKLTRIQVLAVLFRKLKVFIEVKKIKKRRKTYSVPFPVSKKRAFFLISKWILNSIKKRCSKRKAENILAEEIINTFYNKSNCIKMRKVNISSALENKANLHFRW